MIRGWRNDPRWVEHYAKRDHDRIAREIERIKWQHKLEMGRIDDEVNKKYRCLEAALSGRHDHRSSSGQHIRKVGTLGAI